MKGVKTPPNPESGLEARSRGGRPPSQLHLDFVASLARQGLGVRAIARLHFEEFREPISPSTIHRRLRDLRL
jgi:hypothetical protein